MIMASKFLTNHVLKCFDSYQENKRIKVNVNLINEEEEEEDINLTTENILPENLLERENGTSEENQNIDEDLFEENLSNPNIVSLEEVPTMDNEESTNDEAEDLENLSVIENLTNEEIKQEVVKEGINSLLILIQLVQNGGSFSAQLMRECQESDTHIRELRNKCFRESNKKIGKIFLDNQDVLWKERKCLSQEPYPVLFLPQYVFEMILTQVHASGLHLKNTLLNDYMANLFEVQHMKAIIAKVYQKCGVCFFTRKTRRTDFLGEVRTFSTAVPGRVWTTDLIQNLPTSKKGKKNIILFVDQASNFTWGMALRTTRSEEALAALKILISFCGKPFWIYSDGGSPYRDKFSLFCQKHNIKHHRVCGRSQAMGMAEERVGFVKALINSYIFTLSQQFRKIGTNS